jgi:hypothetical protein
LEINLKSNGNLYVSKLGGEEAPIFKYGSAILVKTGAPQYVAKFRRKYILTRQEKAIF